MSFVAKMLYFFLARRAQEPEDLLYERFLSSFRGQLRQLKSRHPFVPAALELLNNPVQLGTTVAQWAEYKSRMEWRENAFRIHTFIKDTSLTSTGISLPKPGWSRLTVSKLVLIYSAQKRTNEVWFLRRPVSVAQRSRQLSTY